MQNAHSACSKLKLENNNNIHGQLRTTMNNCEQKQRTTTAGNDANIPPFSSAKQLDLELKLADEQLISGICSSATSPFASAVCWIILRAFW